MNQKKKYKYLIIAVVVVSIYIFATEVISRWGETIDNYGTLSEREKNILNPDELINKKMDLIAQRRILTTKITHGKGQFEQSQIGVIKLINMCAQESNIFMRSLTPLDSKTAGQMVEHNFRLEVVGTYHGLGAFINDLETGPIPVRIISLDETSQKVGSTATVAIIDGKAFVLSKEAVK
jgi:hypothetical protein